MTTLNMEEIDKTNFKAFRLPDDSIYFGEVVWIDQSGHFTDEATVQTYFQKLAKQEEALRQKEEEEKLSKAKGAKQPAKKPATNQEEEQKEPLLPPNLYKRVRHGVGVQMFFDQDGGVLCKYEGNWDRDRKHGEGRCYFPDKSYYFGQMRYDVMDGYGQYTWSNGNTYQGNWKNGRFEGGGKFVHFDGHHVQGLFKNNYFQRESGLFVNPMMPEEELNNFIEIWKKSDIIKERNFNKKLFNYALVSTFEDVLENIINSLKNKRIPLILSSKQLAISKNETFSNISALIKKTYSEEQNEFNLRYAYMLKKRGESRPYMENIKWNLAETIAKGGCFVINIDDYEQEVYEENYDPDIREFYSASQFPSTIWFPEKFNRPEVFEKVLLDTEIKILAKVSKEFMPIVWSKYRIDQELDRGKVLDRFKGRFSNIIPLEKCDLILMKEEEKKEELPPVIKEDPQVSEQEKSKEKPKKQ